MSAQAHGSLPVIDTDAIARVLDPLTLVARLRQGHREGVQGLDRSYLVERTGEVERGMLVWPAWQHGRALGAKIVSIFPDNETRGLGPNIRSVYVLFDGADGAPLAVMIGESFTRLKTAADSALGASYLAREDVRHLVVLGAGAQARTQIRFLRAVRPSIDRISIWNRTPTKAEDLALELRREGFDAIAADDRAAAVRNADIVSCVTAAQTPVLKGMWLRAGTHLDLVGGFTPLMRECDDEAVLKSRIFVDHHALVSAYCGDICDPMGRGVIRPEAVLGDLFALCRGAVEGRGAADEITMFKNGGGGHLDLMTAMAFYEGWRTGASAPTGRLPRPDHRN